MRSLHVNPMNSRNLCLALLLTLALAVAGAARFMSAGDTRDPCNPHHSGFTDDKQQAIVCYAGNFLVKMLTELNSGNIKTAEHVRIHLLPYLGGIKTLEALLTDDMGDGKCTVCFRSDQGTHDGLLTLRNMLAPEQLEAYDQLDVCYHTLTNRILARLPQDERGMFLTPSTSPSHDSFRQAMHLFRSLFQGSSGMVESYYDVRSCRTQEAAR